jgi:hypothetical protein
MYNIKYHWQFCDTNLVNMLTIYWSKLIWTGHRWGQPGAVNFQWVCAPFVFNDPQMVFLFLISRKRRFLSAQYMILFIYWWCSFIYSCKQAVIINIKNLVLLLFLLSTSENQGFACLWPSGTAPNIVGSDQWMSCWEKTAAERRAGNCHFYSGKSLWKR